MPTNAEQIATIKSQTLAVIVTITANPKPSYNIDGQVVNWADYLAKLRKTVDWCNDQAGNEEVVEVHSRGYA